MKRRLLAYQSAVACSDLCTGAGLMAAPQWTLGWMGISLTGSIAAPANLSRAVLIGYVGAFVFAVGMLCACGVWILLRRGQRAHMEMLWLATAILRASVAVYVTMQVLSLHLALPWLQVAAFDAVCAALQGIGLRRRWLNHALC